MRDPILVAVLDSIIQMGVAFLILVLVLTLAWVVALLIFARRDLRDSETEVARLSRPRHRRPASTAPWPPPPSRAWPDPDPAGWVPCATETPVEPAPVLDRWPFDPPTDAGPLLRNPWEDPPTIPAPVDVADDLEQIADLWHGKPAAQPLATSWPSDAMLAELGARWTAAEAQAAEQGWPPLIASVPADTHTNREGVGADGPDRGGDAGSDGEPTPATGPLDAATSDGAHSHDVGRTEPEPTPHTNGDGVDRPSTVGPNPVDMWVGLAAQDLAG